MKYTNTLLATAAVALLATGCVKPTQQTQSTQPVYSNQQQQPVYEEAAPIVYEDPNVVTTSSSGVDYNQIPTDNTVITTAGTSYPTSSTTTYPQTATTSYPQPAATTYPQPPATSQPVYTNPYETGGANSYPDPYANGGASQPAATSYPAPSSTSAGQGGGGIHLQVAALKDYSAAEQFKNSLSLAPGQSAYVKRGAVNKVIVTGISSVAEANQLKSTRFPGAFIVQGGSMSGGGYTPEPSYNTGGGAYTVNDPYGSSAPASSGGYSSAGGIGVQIGAYSSRTKAQEIANMQHGQHPAVVKKIGRYYKVILTGFSSRSAAKSYINSRGKGFVVSF